ncbi:glycoside hydrolase family 19 protein [Hydrogenophaga sp.]|uniref:glycoside hydrolase family 19 protein n=1 Tax=Hydrogenophaga sp. TaxID=1904254 RepID=UPI003D0B541C
MNASDLASLTARPETDVATWVQPIEAAMSEYGVDTPERQAAFLAQIVHESDGLARLEENLNYSASRLTAVWPHHFYLPPDDAGTREDASQYEHRPELLANLVYAGRLGNGPSASGDGWRFRGRGLVQLTGRTLYTEAGEAMQIDLVNQPDLLLEPIQAARAAGWYWRRIDGNAAADQATPAAFQRLTVAINGDLIGQDHREALWRRAQTLLGVSGAQGVS